MRRLLLLGWALVIVSAGPVLAQAPNAGSGAAGAEDAASAVLRDGSGVTVGTATLRQAAAGVLLDVEFSRLAPGVHGFHVHEHGRCDAPGFESAGGHLSIAGARHGFLHEAQPHEGDMPNITVPESGRLSVAVLLREVTLGAGKESLFDSDGSALVVHAQPDDYHSQPAGAAGDRIACGVIVRGR